jgi:hypothetical protein
VSLGKAPSDIPTLKPYWGKLTVRNFREGDGNVGIMRSPLRAIALPDPRLPFPERVTVCQAVAESVFRREKMLKITRAANGDVVLKLSGRMDAENVGELETLISAEASGRRLVLDLKDLMLVDQDVVGFLRRCEADSIRLKNCPAYIREWIRGERR